MSYKKDQHSGENSLNYSKSTFNEPYQTDPELKEKVKIHDSERIDKFLEKLDVNLPPGDEEPAFIEGEIRILHGYESSFQQDLMEDNTTYARFDGFLKYDGEKHEVAGSYEEKATDVFLSDEDSTVETSDKPLLE